MSEALTVERLRDLLAERAVALAAAQDRAERAEAEASQRDARIEELEGYIRFYRPQRELLEAITDRVLAAILVLDGKELRAKWANPACRRMLDEPYRSQLDIAGLPVAKFLPGADEIGLIRMLRQVAETGRAEFDPESEYGGFQRGTTYWRWSIVPLPNGEHDSADLLLVANELTDQVVSRRQVEAANTALRASQAELAAELAAALQLQNISTQLIRQENTGSLYQQILDAAIALMHADMGIIQACDAESGGLRLLAWRGLAPEWAAFWERVAADSQCCCGGAALQEQKRVIVADIESSEFMASIADLDQARRSGVRAVQSTPLFSRSGHIVGMLSTHWRAVHQPAERELRLLDVLARQAADLIERTRASDALVRANDELDRHVQERTAELARANATLQYQADLLRNINDAVVATDDQYRISAFNHAAEEMYGWKLEDVLGRPVEDILCSEFVSSTREQAIEDLKTEGRWQGEVIIHCRDGGALFSDVRSMVLRDAAGHVTGYVAVNRDITQRKQAEESLRASREELRAYARRLVQAGENERRHLARELHDQAGQSLSALKLSLGYLRRDVDASERQTRLEEIERLADSVMDDLHRLAMNLRPVSLDRYGLVPALQQYADFYRGQSGLHMDLVVVGIEEQRLPADVETAVYRVIQEALTNVFRHAAAQRVDVMLHRRNGRVIAIIDDDGQGFDVEQAMHCGRLGLLGMRERAEMLGGSLSIESVPARGTTIYLDLPCLPGEAEFG